MGRFFIGLGALLLVILVATSSYLVLQACGFFSPFGLSANGACLLRSEEPQQLRLAELTNDNAALARQVAALEAELAGQQCVVEQFPEVAAVEEPQLIADMPEREIDAAAWEAGDISSLEGCWELEANFTATNVRTNTVTHYNQWDMCFNAAGNGRGVQTATSGVECETGVTGRFSTPGQFEFNEATNSMCTDDTFIYRSVGRCTLDDEGRASCQIRQPETGSDVTIYFRRAAGGRADG